MKEFIEKLISRLEELYARNDKTKKMAYEEQDWEKFDLFTHRCEGIYSAIEIVKQEAEQYNNGWIPCSEQLPKEDEKVYISTKTERVYVGVYTKRYGFEKREGFICDDGFMWMNTALAWKPYVLPAPYQPKGE